MHLGAAVEMDGARKKCSLARHIWVDSIQCTSVGRCDSSSRSGRGTSVEAHTTARHVRKAAESDGGDASRGPVGIADESARELQPLHRPDR